MWPFNPWDVDWFTGETIPVENSLPLWEGVRVRGLADALPPSPQPSRRGRGGENPPALWIAKADALPDHWNVGADQIVWASGGPTWERPARRGGWVDGRGENPGEQETPQIEKPARAAVACVKLS